jgi:hypothetical protein
MALSFGDRVKETSSTTGTGTYTLGGAVAGYQTFAAGVGTGKTTNYCATDGTNWEVGTGVYTTSGSNTLTRATIIASSNSGSAVNWGAGSRTISCVGVSPYRAAWTPAVTFGGGSTGITYTSRIGYYRKVGSLIHFSCFVNMSSKGSSTGTALIGGLPTPSTSPAEYWACAVRPEVMDGTVNSMQALVIYGTTAIELTMFSGGAVTTLTDAHFSNTSKFTITGWYEA